MGFIDMLNLRKLTVVALCACSCAYSGLSIVSGPRLVSDDATTGNMVFSGVSVQAGDVVAIATSPNKDKATHLLSLQWSGTEGVDGTSATLQSADLDGRASYVYYVDIANSGTYTFTVTAANASLTAKSALFVLRADSGSIAVAATAMLAANTGTPGLSYIFSESVASGVAIESISSKSGKTLSADAAYTLLDNENGRIPLYSISVNGSAWAKTHACLEGVQDFTGAGAVFVEQSTSPQPPSFNTDPVVETAAFTNEVYSASLADDATDPNGDQMTFWVSPTNTWLSVATNGVLSGTPLSGDLGTNSWTVYVSDGMSGTNSATLKIVVAGGTPVPQTSQTNIVLIVIDDLGWMDLSIQGSEFYETPRIDGLATNGMRFTQGYAAHPRCLPSRYGLMTGRFPGASAVPADAPDLIDEEVTIGEALQPAGYETFFAGKWHISHETVLLPQNQGFDINITGGAPGAPPSYFYPYGNQPADETDKNGLFLDNTTPVGGMVTDRITGKSYKRTFNAGESGEYITDRLTDEALDWMDWNADKPMFLYMSHYGVHTPFEAPATLITKYTNKLTTMDYGDLPEEIASGIGTQKMRQDHPTYAAMIESVDINIGRLMDKVAELGIAGNTIFIFTSDNGGLSNRGGNNTRTLATSNYPLRTGKGWLYEGGIREAFIVKGPGVVPMVNSKAVVNGTDIYPTILELAGVALRPDDHRNGISFKSALGGGAYDRGASILWHSPKARPYSTGDFNSSALRDGDYKLIWWYDTPGRDGEFHYELYNVKTDPGENNDLALTLPAKAADLLAQIKSWHNHEHWERPGSGVSQEPDDNDISKPPQAWVDDPAVPAGLMPNGANMDIYWGDYLGFDYKIFSKTNLLDITWMPESSGITTNGTSLPMDGNEAFYKVDLVLQPEA